MNKKGFTLIELLVVIAIIGLLSTLAVVALGSARQKARDSKRLSDVKQIQTALELYFTDNNSYPTTTGATADLGMAGYECLGGAGFADSGDCSSPIYMGLVPKEPTPTQGQYIYTVDADLMGYTIALSLEGTINDLTGCIEATQNGILSVTCP